MQCYNRPRINKRKGARFDGGMSTAGNDAVHRMFLLLCCAHRRLSSSPSFSFAFYLLEIINYECCVEKRKYVSSYNNTVCRITWYSFYLQMICVQYVLDETSMPLIYSKKSYCHCLVHFLRTSFICVQYVLEV